MSYRDYCEGLRDSLDLVVIGAWYGQGRKVKWYSPFLLAAYDPETEEYRACAAACQASVTPSMLRSAACPRAALHEAAVTIMQAAALHFESFSLFRPGAHAHSRMCSPRQQHSQRHSQCQRPCHCKSSPKALLREHQALGVDLPVALSLHWL